jgi:hypothetical protein
MLKYLLIFLCFTAKAQVINGSFEQGSCPTFIANLPDNWVNIRFDANLISGCVESGQTGYTNVGTPCNYFGCQEPQDGNNYIAISLGSQQPEIREWIRGEIEPLAKDSLYRVTFWYSKSDRYSMSSNNIGAYFGNVPYQSITDYSIFDYSKVVSESSSYCDTVNWIFFDRLYYAEGGESNIYLGNFFPDAQTKLEECYQSNLNEAYYYIDNVQIEKVNWVGVTETPYKKTIAAIYDVMGNKYDTFTWGLNIVVYSNGETVKAWR